MSINVTVKGHPISIKHGKMVTVGSDYASEELRKRRKIRLEQVRQQSKEIAENLRNKVKKEKEKQISQIEKDGAAKLKQWQNKKLMQLQNQYRDCLDIIGVGHSQAEVEKQAEQEYLANQSLNKDIAEERGLKAAQKLNIEREERNQKDDVAKQRKLYSRDVENARSAMVTKLNKKKKSPFKKKKIKKKSIDIDVDHSDSDLDSDLPIFLDLSSRSSASSTTSTQRGIINTNPSIATTTSTTTVTTTTSNMNYFTSDRVRKQNVQSSAKAKIGTDSDILPSGKRFEFPVDTRISDRIKSRSFRTRFNSEFDDKNNEERIFPCFKLTKCSSDNKVSSGISLGRKPEKLDEPLTVKHSDYDKKKEIMNPISSSNLIESNLSDKFCSPSNCTYKKQQDIPYKPSISMIPPKEDSNSLKQSSVKSNKNRTQYYDYNNKFSKQCEVEPEAIQRISVENIKMCDCGNIENDILQNINKRDKIALERGKKALEKEKIQRDYEELMQKLPVLQKQEKIASINPKKTAHHMSNDRIKEKTNKFEARIENAYEKLLPITKPPVVTLPSKRQEAIEINSTTPFKTIDVSGSPPTLNIASWDVTNNLETKNKDQLSNTEKLHELLLKLKEQKESLLREVEDLPNESHLEEILNYLNNKGKNSDLIASETKNDCSTDNSDLPKKRTIKSFKKKKEPIKEIKKKVQEDNINLQKNKEKSNDSSLKESSNNSSKNKEILKESTSSASSKHKCKSRKTLILQNTSTQTTPKNDQISTKSEINSNAVLTEQCKCADEEKLCEIVIKINDDKIPEIRVSPNKTKESSSKSKESSMKSLTQSEDVTSKITIEKPCKDKPTSVKKLKSKHKLAVKKVNGVISKKKSVSKNSWSEHLKSFEKNGTSTSTSYFSPPDYKKDIKTDVKEPSCENISNSSKLNKFDPRLLTYIKKLLAMSHTSIENLAISSASEIPTPNSSIIDIETNNPLQQLHNVMKFFNINMDDLNELLKYPSNVPDNESSSAFANSSVDSNKGYDASESNLKFTFEGNSTLRDDQKSSESASIVFNKNCPDVMQTYSEIADNCHKRISDLNAMIEKVRKEKQEFLDKPYSSESDKENSTCYKNLPKNLERLNDEKTDSNDSSLEQERLTEHLLKIDFSLAENLKSLRNVDCNDGQKKDSYDDVEKDLFDRYKKLLQPCENTDSFKNKEKMEPFLLNIPKLDKLPLKEVGTTNKNRRPPTAKAINCMRKLNDNLLLEPHELSTIMEGDTIISARRSKSPVEENKTNLQNKNAVDATDTTDESMPDLLSELIENVKACQVTSKSSSSEKEKNISINNLSHNLKSVSDSSTEVSLESIETMLKSMGMNWAISTLRKTQKAFEQSSSTSSMDGSLNKQNYKMKESSGSDVSLHSSIIQKQFIAKLSSSSDSDILYLMKEFGELSSISGSGGTVDKNQRTSTPVPTTKSSDKSKSSSKQLFTGESDVSSVKPHEDQFVNLSLEKTYSDVNIND